MLTREELDLGQCEAPGCSHENGQCGNELWIHGRCHFGAPTWACYHKDTGTLDIVCSECDQVIVKIAVA